MPRRLPPLNALRAFEAAARHSSFAKAAAELNVTPAAISHQVKGLEDQLGVALFTRLPRGLVLTKAGEMLLPGLVEGFDRLARATERVRAAANGLLTISVLPSFASCWLMPRLAEFGERHPEIDVELRTENRNVDFDVEPIDLAIRYGNGAWPGLYVELLMGEETFPVASARLAEGPPPITTPADLRRVVLLHDAGARASEPWIQWPTWLHSFGVDDFDSERGPRFYDTTLILRAAVAGRGVAIGRSALVGDMLRNGELVRLFGVSQPADYQYYLVAPEPALANPKVAAFVQWLRLAATRD